VIEGTPANFMQNRTLRNVVVFGRLRPGASLDFDFDCHLDFSFSTWLAHAKELQTQGVRSL
jgi:hypothetical protein